MALKSGKPLRIILNICTIYKSRRKIFAAKLNLNEVKSLKTPLKTLKATK